MGYNEAVLEAREQDWDHKFFLDEGMADPVGREDADEPLVVSSDPDEEVKHLLPSGLNSYCLRAHVITAFRL